MSVSSNPRILVYTAGGTIAAGHAVKFGADNKHVVECTASTDTIIGIAQIPSGQTASTGNPVEVAHPGGGGKACAHTTITAGQMLVPYTDGTLQPVTGSGDRIGAMAMDSAVAGDIFDVEVIAAVGTTANQ